MGANIGTSVTNTLVSLAQVSDRDQFRRAFAGATVHDMFNILSVLVFLPIEVACGYLYITTEFLVTKMNLQGRSMSKKEFLKKLTNPFTKMIIQLDESVITRIAKGDKSAESQSLVKYWCDKGQEQIVTVMQHNFTLPSNSSSLIAINKTIVVHSKPCKFLLHGTGLSDSVIGLITLFASLLILCCCLVGIVKLLQSILQGRIAIIVKRTVNNDLPKPFGFLTGYCAIIVGAGLTILVQSSSIFTSTLTPLVGLGVVSLDRIFPLTLGSNIGTTGTSIIAAMASSGDQLHFALQIALCHLFFNLSGIALWYPIPAMRKVPINMAKCLGNTTAKYRWFAPVYIILFFFLVPGTIFGLSMAGKYYIIGIGGSFTVVILFVIILNLLQAKVPTCLPVVLRTWQWAPVLLRSLEPYDKVITKLSEFGRNVRKNSHEKKEVKIHLKSGEYVLDEKLPNDQSTGTASV